MAEVDNAGDAPRVPVSHDSFTNKQVSAVLSLLYRYENHLKNIHKIYFHACPYARKHKVKGI